MVTEVVLAIMMVIPDTMVIPDIGITTITVIDTEAMDIETTDITDVVTTAVITVDITDNHIMAVITATTAPATDAMDMDMDIQLTPMAIRRTDMVIPIVTVLTVTDTIRRITAPGLRSVSGSASFVKVKPGPPRRTG